MPLNTDLIKLNNLQLAAKIVSEELFLGIHGSRRSGMGVEFEQYRHYEIGDDPKRIDWKRYAQTEKHLIRESATESNLKISLVLDLSGSMNYEENGISRLAYCKILLASLAYLAYRQNDDCSLFSLQDGDVQTLVSTGKQAFQRIFYSLEKATAKGVWQNQNPKFPAFQHKQKEILVIASDFLQVEEEWLKLIQNIANPRRQILIFQVLGKQELNFNLQGFYRFQDLETGKEIELDARSVQTAFQEKANNYLKKIDQALQIPNVKLIRTNLQKPITQTILEGLKLVKT